MFRPRGFAEGSGYRVQSREFVGGSRTLVVPSLPRLNLASAGISMSPRSLSRYARLFTILVAVFSLPCLSPLGAVFQLWVLDEHLSRENGRRIRGRRKQSDNFQS